MYKLQCTFTEMAYAISFRKYKNHWHTWVSGIQMFFVSIIYIIFP